MKYLLYSMATAYNLEDYHRHRATIQQQKDGNKMIKWIDDAEPKMWCRALFSSPRFGVSTSNTVEIIFSAFLKQRHLPTLDLMLFIERYVLEKCLKALKTASAMTNKVTDKAIKIIEKQSNRAVHLNCNQIDKLWLQ